MSYSVFSWGLSGLYVDLSVLNDFHGDILVMSKFSSFFLLLSLLLPSVELGSSIFAKYSSVVLKSSILACYIILPMVKVV